MQQVKIYIETDSSSPKATEKHYGYVLEVMVSGQAVTREGFGKITGTYHQTVLTALAKALDRFNQSCEVCICTEDNFVLNMLERNLAIWAGNEFLTSKRKPVANQQEWMEIWRLSNRHLILTEPGKHEYTGWLQDELTGQIYPINNVFISIINNAMVDKDGGEYEVTKPFFNSYRGILWKNNVCKLRAHFRTDDKNIKVLENLKGVDITPEVPEE